MPGPGGGIFRRAKLLILMGMGLGGGLAGAAPVGGGRLLVRGGVLFTERPDETQPRQGYLLAGADGRILRADYGDPPPGLEADTVVDATGKLIMPGFVSGHNHPYQAALRGLATDQALLGWLDVIRPLRVGPSADDRYYFTLFGCLDLLRHGITTAFNFNDSGGEAGIDQRAFDAERASGLRFVHGYCLPFGGTRASRRADFEQFYAYTRPFRAEPTFLAVALGGYAYGTPNTDYIMVEGEIMARYGLYNQAHFLESADPHEISTSRAKFDWFAASGELGPRLSFGHLVHADDAILARIAAAGSGMIWNPLSNGRLASGTPDILKMRRLGIRIGMGVDGQASADIADPFENMRAGLYVIRARAENAAVLAPRDVLGFHTRGSADVIGVAAQVGTLEAGKFADFLILDPHSMDTGPVVDPYGTLVLACGTSNLEAVYVGGRLLVDHGRCMDPDAGRIGAEVQKRMAAFRATKPQPSGS